MTRGLDPTALKQTTEQRILDLRNAFYASRKPHSSTKWNRRKLLLISDQKNELRIRKKKG